jgi:hypothetical protein
MKRSSKNNREDRLGSALKENLKRRKALPRKKASTSGAPPSQALGTAPQAGLEEGQKTAPKRG